MGLGDWPGFAKLQDALASLPAPAEIKVVSMGDEIKVRAPSTYANDSTFQTWARDVAKLQLSDLMCKDWLSCNMSTNATLAHTNPVRFYHSMIYTHSAGIAYYAATTKFMRRNGLTNAKIGANYSPGNCEWELTEW